MKTCAYALQLKRPGSSRARSSILFCGLKLRKMLCCSCGAECVSAAIFAINVVTKSTVRRKNSVQLILIEYFHRGYSYSAIVSFLEKFDGVRMHERTLKRKLWKLGLRRKGDDHDEDVVRELIKWFGIHICGKISQSKHIQSHMWSRTRLDPGLFGRNAHAHVFTFYLQ